MPQLPSGGSGVYTVLGVLLVLGLVGYELYKRANSQSDEGKTKKKNGSRKKGKKG